MAAVVDLDVDVPFRRPRPAPPALPTRPHRPLDDLSGGLNPLGLTGLESSRPRAAGPKNSRQSRLVDIPMRVVTQGKVLIRVLLVLLLIAEHLAGLYRVINMSRSRLSFHVPVRRERTACPVTPRRSFASIANR